MIRMLLAAAVAAAVVSSPGSRPTANRVVGEPPFQLLLEIDGVELPVVDGQHTEVSIGDRKVKVKARVLPTRRFSEHGVQFEFPRDMAYEFDPAGGIDTWTLDGNNCTLLLNRYETDGVADLVDGVFEATAAAMGGDIDKAKPVEWRLGAIQAKGRTLIIDLMGTSMQVTVLGIEDKDAAIVLVVQDVLGDNGEVAEDSRRVRELLTKSFAVGQK
jgi:hypothetical protein